MDNLTDRPASPPATEDAAPAASREVRREHSDDRWARWAATNTSRDFTTTRRLQIIAGVIGAGLVVWLVWTI